MSNSKTDMIVDDSNELYDLFAETHVLTAHVRALDGYGYSDLQKRMSNAGYEIVDTDDATPDKPRWDKSFYIAYRKIK